MLWVRKGLKAKVTDRDQNLLIELQSGGAVGVEAFANGQSLGEVKTVNPGKKMSRLEIPLEGNEAWIGSIGSLEVALYGDAGSHVEVDSIQVER